MGAAGVAPRVVPELRVYPDLDPFNDDYDPEPDDERPTRREAAWEAAQDEDDGFEPG